MATISKEFQKTAFPLDFCYVSVGFHHSITLFFVDDDTSIDFKARVFGWVSVVILKKMLKTVHFFTFSCNPLGVMINLSQDNIQ